MVRLFICITDQDWFEALAAAPPDELNFWQPSGRNTFRTLRPGELFLFKLHAPRDVIVGGGVFSHASLVPLSIAWEAFGAKNGAASLAEMRRRIARYRRDPSALDERVDPVIGCRVLTQPFFWPQHLWLPVPASFARNIVQGRGYTTDEADGRALWDAISDRLSAMPADEARPVSNHWRATFEAMSALFWWSATSTSIGAPSTRPPKSSAAIRTASTAPGPEMSENTPDMSVSTPIRTTPSDGPPGLATTRARGRGAPPQASVPSASGARLPAALQSGWAFRARSRGKHGDPQQR